MFGASGDITTYSLIAQTIGRVSKHQKLNAWIRAIFLLRKMLAMVARSDCDEMESELLSQPHGARPEEPTRR